MRRCARGGTCVFRRSEPQGRGEQERECLKCGLLEFEGEAWPRDARNRYRIVKVYRGGKPETLVSTPTKEGVGTALIELHGDGEFEGVRVGVYDCLADKNPWVIHPYETGGAK